MATTLATTMSYTTSTWHADTPRVLPQAQATPDEMDEAATAGSALGQIAAVVTALVLAVGLGALVLAEYYLLWQALFVPWLATVP
jgi:hypothetical protein